VPERLDAHRLIEEFMIQANVAAAETLEAKNASPLVYRIHDAALAGQARGAARISEVDELVPEAGGNLRPAQLQPHPGPRRRNRARARWSTRSCCAQAQAEYPRRIRPFRPEPAPLRAFHLADPPLRRPDRPPRADPRAGSRPGGLPGIEEALPRSPRRFPPPSAAPWAERDTVDRLVANWLADRIGATFRGRISGVTRAGLFVKLDETGADGFVPMRTLGADYFRYDEARHALIGSRTGEMHRLGDRWR
jgi:ribonuclease R